MHIIFFLHFGRSEKFHATQGPSERVGDFVIFIFESFLKFWKEDHLIYLFHLQLFFQYQNMREGNNMTFPKFRKNKDLIIKSNFGFRSFVFLFIWIGKNACFQKLHTRPRVKFILFHSILGVGEKLSLVILVFI